MSHNESAQTTIRRDARLEIQPAVQRAPVGIGGVPRAVNLPASRRGTVHLSISPLRCLLDLSVRTL